MIAEPLRRALEATGYLVNGEPAAPSVILGAGDGSGADTHSRGTLSFQPEVQWRSSTSLSVYFKYVPETPRAEDVGRWQKEVWNRGFAPLLWIVSPDRIDLYNGFGIPQTADDVEKNRLDTFHHIDAHLQKLDALAGRLAMETGQFWRREPRVNREHSVDRRLLRDLGHLERKLVAAHLPPEEAQGLIGRSIFANYLIDRKIVPEQRLKKICGQSTLPGILRTPDSTKRLFNWFSETFNGDMFPSSVSVPVSKYLEQVARFLEAEDLENNQLSLFPYQFDVIPVELISSIYEQFVHSAGKSVDGGTKKAKGEGVYYTPLPAVSLVLDEVMDGLTGNETILDLTCGSGVFLVEALRRLVYLKSDGRQPSRKTIRETLYEQVYGVDKSKAAVRIAAFSLYLAALELDADPQPPEALRFEPLEGRTLLVGDAREIELTRAGRKILMTDAGLKRFDVIVGNPPWSFRGKAGTEARRSAGSGAPLQPRGQSLDFVVRANQFAHANTRFGMILSATPFFSRSSTGIEAARNVVEALAPVTLVNLSDLSGWLFPKANMPAIMLLTRHRKQRADWMTLVQASWSLAGERSHTFEIAPSDITTLPIASWKRNPGLFKAAFLGRRHDLLLLDELWEKHEPLKARLGTVSARLRAGLIIGDHSRNATFLTGLPFAQRTSIRHFHVPDDLPEFDQDRAERPRDREIYLAPLLLVNKFMQGGPRLVSAVAEKTTVFTDAYYGASFPSARSNVASLVAGILGSALASWHFLMTGSAFGLWMRQLKLRDIDALPVPDLERAVESDIGKEIVQFVNGVHHEPTSEADWGILDNAVFDLYSLDDADRIVVRDGLFRASWQWKQGRLESAAPANLDDLQTYAAAFLSTMDGWLSASNRRRMRAEIYELTPDAPLRIVRFVLENAPGPSVVEVVSLDGSFSSVLSRIGERTRVRITDALVGMQDLRVHAKDEVSIIKPAERRNWLGVRGLEDADAVVKDSAHGGRAT